MAEMHALGVTFLLSGVLLIGAMLPLVFRKVGRNGFFGIRITSTLESDQNWFDLNEVGGMLLSLTGFPLLVGGALAFFVPEQFKNELAIATGLSNLAAIGFAIFFFSRYTKRYLSDREALAKDA